ncbi:MAG: rhodanese-like domain-containing protein [Flavobacteriales bacterium]|nr:rhodanese-like domain-containing protein [Flavobacteriales bacterium]
MKYFTLGFMLLGWFTSFFAQDKVEGAAYGMMLKGLLSHSVNEITVPELRKEKEVVLLDARELREFEVSHIKEALFVGYDNYDLSVLDEVPKEKRIVVYCSVGYRSEKIAEKIKALGYQDVSNLYGGIFEWKNQDGLVVNDRGHTEDVHAYDKVWGVWLKKGRKIYK